MHPFSSLNHLHTKNQHTYNRGNNMTFNEQGVSSDTNGQIHTPNNSSFMQQQNTSYMKNSSTNPFNSLNNNNIRPFPYNLPPQRSEFSPHGTDFSSQRMNMFPQRINFSADRNNLSPHRTNLPSKPTDFPQRSNGIFNMGNSALGQSNFPRMNEVAFNNKLKNDIAVSHPRTFMGDRSYANSIRAFEKPEFKISKEDFPELPHSSCSNSNETIDTIVDQQLTIKSSNSTTKLINKNKSKELIDQNDEIADDETSIAGNISDTELSIKSNDKIIVDDKSIVHDKSIVQKKCVKILPNGKLANIPANMIKDQFGIASQLLVINMAENGSNMTELNMGDDLISLGLDLNSSDDLLPKFGGPFFRNELQPFDANIESDPIGYRGLPEYKVNDKIRNKLAPIKLSVYEEDLLFYLFYTHAGNKIQLEVAKELYTRGWRYHIELRVWLMADSEENILEKTPTFERGTYCVFDYSIWKKAPKELLIEYDKLERTCDLIVNDDTIKEPITLDDEWIQSIGFPRLYN